MRYYISYKFLGLDKEELKKKLNVISSAIEEMGYGSFIFFRDKQNWGTIQMSIDEIIKSAFFEINKSEVFFAFVESDEKSEGMLLEAGYAKASNKKIILAIKKGIDLRFLRSIADTIIEFDDFSSLKEKIKSKIL
jgi:hypothetical protein